MGEDVASDGLGARGGGEHGGGAWVGLDLVGHDDGDVELLGELGETREAKGQEVV